MATTPLPRTRLVRSTALASVALVLLCASSQGQTPPQARQATTPSARFRPAVIHPKMTPDQRHAIESFGPAVDIELDDQGVPGLRRRIRCGGRQDSRCSGVPRRG
jgi:hypothetical protein